MSATPFRIGVQGLGVAGSLMAEACAAHPGVRLTAGADPNEALARRFAETFSAKAFPNADAMLDHVDAIYIATPHQHHADHAVAATRAGKHVIVEKPMALSLRDCDRMIKAAADAGVRLIVGHTHGFDPTITAMRALIDSGETGPVVSTLSFNFTDFMYRPRRPEELDTTQGGGIIFNQLPHQIDIIRSLNSSPVESVRASAAILDRDRPTEGFCNAFIQFADGPTAAITYSGYDRFDSDELHAWTAENGQPKSADHGVTRAALHATVNELETRRRGRAFSARAPVPARQPHFGSLIVTCRDADLRATPDGLSIYDSNGARDVRLSPTSPWPGHGAVLDELIATVRDGASPMHDGAFGRDTLAVCLAILQSSKTRTEVRIADVFSDPRSLPC